MSTIDQRIVEMKFNNAQFEKGVRETVNSMESLKSSLKLDGVAKDVGSISSKVSAFGAIAFSAIQRLTNSAIDFGSKIAGAVLDPLVEGGKKRALNIEQARFQFQGLGMDVEATMASALAAVKGTAFGLDEAAVVAANFGATGMRAGEQMTNALRGISGVAAMAGSSYSDIGDIFQKVAGQGRLMGDDLNRLAARGINAAATMSKQFGITESEFRDLVSKGQISFQMFADAMNTAFGEHATKANETYTGSLSNMRAALARIGAAFAGPHFEQQRDLFNSLTPAIDGVATALEPVVKFVTDLGRAKIDAIRNIVDALTFSRVPNKLPPFFQALQNVFKFFIGIAAPIRRAFTNIFPAPAAGIIKGMAETFLNFTKRLKVSADMARNIRRTFQGVFAVFDILWTVIRGVVGVIGRLIGEIAGGAGSFLHFTGNVGDSIKAFRDFIKESGIITKIFKTIGDILIVPVKALKFLAAAIFGTAESTGVLAEAWSFLEPIVNGVVTAFVNLGKTLSGFFGFGRVADEASGAAKEVGALQRVWEGVANAAKTAYEFIKPVVDWIVDRLREVKDAIKNAVGGMDMGLLVGALNAGGLIAVLGLLWKYLGKLPSMLENFGANFGSNFGGGFMDKVRGIFDQLTASLEAMQTKLKSEALMNIAIAIALLTASVVALSFVDIGRMSVALGAMTVMFGQLIAALWALEKATGSLGSIKMASIVLALTGLATAMLILSVALRIIATMDWDELTRGLVGLAVGMLTLTTMAELLGKSSSKIIFTAPAIAVLAGALILLSVALKVFSTMSWDDIGRSLTVLAGALTILGVAMSFIQSKVFAAASMLVIAAAMTVLAGALKIFSTMSWDDITRGLTVLGVSLLMLALGMEALHSKIFAAASMLIISVALTVLAGALKIFSKMSWEEVAKALVMLGGSLLILAGAMALMGLGPVLLGAVGLTAASIALMMLAPALKILGSMSWDDIGRGLALLASALAIMAVGGVLLIPAIPAFLALGGAIMMIGVGAALASIGLTGIALAITALAAAGTLGLMAFKNAVLVIVSLIPQILTAVAVGIVEFAKTLASKGAELTKAFVTLLTTLLDAIIEIMPKVGELIQALVDLLVQVMIDNIPQLVDAGLKMLIGILDGIANNIERVVDSATNVIVNFINGLGKESNVNKIIKAGGDLVYNWLKGLGDYIRNNTSRFVSAGSSLFRAVVDGISQAIERGAGDLRWAGQRIASALWNGALSFLGIASPSKKFANELMPWVFAGIEKGGDRGIKRAGAVGSDIGGTMFTAVQKSLDQIKSAVASDFKANPTIRPVLDLSGVRKDAGLIGGILKPPTLDVSTANRAAASTYDAITRTQAAQSQIRASEEPVAGDNITFIQNNNSPKALDNTEIYRNTRNQISTAKRELANVK